MYAPAHAIYWNNTCKDSKTFDPLHDVHPEKNPWNINIKLYRLHRTGLVLCNMSITSLCCPSKEQTSKGNIISDIKLSGYYTGM